MAISGDGEPGETSSNTVGHEVHVGNHQHKPSTDKVNQNNENLKQENRKQKNQNQNQNRQTKTVSIIPASVTCERNLMNRATDNHKADSDFGNGGRRTATVTSTALACRQLSMTLRDEELNEIRPVDDDPPKGGKNSCYKSSSGATDASSLTCSGGSDLASSSSSATLTKRPIKGSITSDGKPNDNDGNMGGFNEDDIRHIDSAIEGSPVEGQCPLLSNGDLRDSSSTIHYHQRQQEQPQCHHEHHHEDQPTGLALQGDQPEEEVRCECNNMPSTVYKKQSPNARLTLYLSTREFVHFGDGKVSSIDGVVLVEPGYLQDRRVFAMVVLTFRYGREDEEVMGLKFYTEAILDYRQVYPEPANQTTIEELTPLQETLMRKLGTEAYPLTLRVSPKAPPSVRLHPARPYIGSPLGVSYEIKVFITDKNNDKPHKRNMVRMSLKTVEYAPETTVGIIRDPMCRPRISIVKHFILSSGRLEIQAVLDKECYQQGEPLHVHVTLNNSTRTKTVQRLKVSVIQHVNVCMFTHGRFKNIIGTGDSSEGGAGSSAVTPMSRAQRDFVVVLERCEKFPVALAVESDYGHDDPSHYSLSSTTSLVDPKDKNPYGVSVQYEVKIKAILGWFDRHIIVRIPFKIVAIRPKDSLSTGRYLSSEASQTEHRSGCQSDRKLSQQFPCALLNSAEFVSQELDNRKVNESPSPSPSPEPECQSIRSPHPKNQNTFTGS